MFYRQKGQRSPTRPQAIHESFELCAEALVQRLVGYRSQAEDYHNCCIQGEHDPGGLGTSPWEAWGRVTVLPAMEW